MGIQPVSKIIEMTFRLYHIVKKRNSVRSTNDYQILAICCYIVCRCENKSIFLCDFSRLTLVNQFKLGSLYFKICNHLQLVGQDILQKLSDLCVYVNKIVFKLDFGIK